MSAFLDIENWGSHDAHPGRELDDIEPVSARALCLLERQRTKAILRSHYIHLRGAVEMMHGLDYHAANFMRIVQEEESDTKIPGDPAAHEAVAYLNRLGQFRTFTRSDLVRASVPEVEDVIPTIVALMPFRNKFTAHRSIDDPRNETPHEQIVHAHAISVSGRRLYTPRPGVPSEPPA